MVALGQKGLDGAARGYANWRQLAAPALQRLVLVDADPALKRFRTIEVGNGGDEIAHHQFRRIPADR